MPYKANEPRRHKIPKARYRVSNWPEYDRALQQRGSLTVLCGRPSVWKSRFNMTDGIGSGSDRPGRAGRDGRACR